MDETSAGGDDAIILFQDATETIRHYDKERMAFSRLTLAIISAIIGLMSVSGVSLDKDVLYAGALLTGAIGWLSSRKFASLIALHRGRAAAAAEVLRGSGRVVLSDGAATAQGKLAARWPVMSRIPVQALWTAYYALALVGLSAAWCAR